MDPYNLANFSQKSVELGLYFNEPTPLMPAYLDSSEVKAKIQYIVLTSCEVTVKAAR